MVTHEYLWQTWIYLYRNQAICSTNLIHTQGKQLCIVFLGNAKKVMVLTVASYDFNTLNFIATTGGGTVIKYQLLSVGYRLKKCMYYAETGKGGVK